MGTSRAAWPWLAALALATPVLWIWLRAAEDPANLAAAPPRAAPAPEAAAPADEASLRHELGELRARNRELEAQVRWLSAQLEALHWLDEVAEAGHEAGADADDAGGLAPAGGRGDPGAPAPLAPGSEAPQREPGSAPWFDAEGLAAAGVPEHEIARLREVFDASELALIELEHEARRDGYFRTPRYAEALRDMRTELREELGDDRWDLLLYASGRANRVIVDGVLNDAPGALAGLQKGDVIVGYDSQRIFRGGEFKSATVSGRLGEPVVVEVLRDGEPLRLRLPRGPLGVRFRSARILPEVR